MLFAGIDANTFFLAQSGLCFQRSSDHSVPFPQEKLGSYPYLVLNPFVWEESVDADRYLCVTGTYFIYIFVRVGSALKMYPNPPFSIHFKIVTVFASGARHVSEFTKIITSLPYSLSHRSAGYDRGIVFLPFLTQSLISFRDKVQYSSQSLFLYTSLFLVPSSFYDIYILCCGSGYRFGNRNWTWVQEVRYRYGHRKRAGMFFLEG